MASSDFQLPPLPPLNDKLHLQMRGPTLASNWVIPGMVMQGAYPGALDDRDNDRQLKTILARGVDTFVCLQMELDEDMPEEIWRTGRELRPYFIDARRLSKKPLVWRHLPIMDGNAADDDEVLETLICDLVDDVKAGRVLYVHCWGGHGRAGLICCLLLAVLYSLTPVETFKRIQAYHDCRVEPQGTKSPQTVAQRNQVKRLLDKWKQRSEQPEPDRDVDTRPASREAAKEPQVVIGQNGVRGFVVPTIEKSASLPNVCRDANRDLSAAPRMAASGGKLQANNSRVKSFQSGQSRGAGLSGQNQLISMHPSVKKNVPISLHPSKNALMTAPQGKVPMAMGATGTGASCVKLLRKSSGVQLSSFR